MRSKRLHLSFSTVFIMTLTLSTLNVRSVRSQVRTKTVLSFLQTQSSDILLLQECALPFMPNYKRWEEQWPHLPSVWSGSNFNRADGVAILIKNPHLLVKGSTVVRDGRALLINLSFLGCDFNVLNIYGFTDKNDRYDLLEDLQPHLLGKTPLVLAGDFNCVLSKNDRKKGEGDAFTRDKTSILLQNIIKDFKLTDCFRTMHPGEKGLTWFSGDGTKASRIDYIFARDLVPVAAKLTPVFFSDHAMLSCTLSFPTGVTIGRGIWRLNCSLLEDLEITAHYREQYGKWQTLQDFYNSRVQWWEMVKEKTKTFFRWAGKKKKLKERRQMVGLQRRLQRYFYLLSQGFDFNNEIKEVKKEMLELAEVKSRGIIFRSREKELEEGEKCTRYFFKKIINGGGAMVNLRNKEGEKMADTDGIFSVVENFYKELYDEKVSDENILREVLTCIGKTVKDDTALINDFNLSEIDKSVKDFKRGKAPGADGLPLEFYLTFWDILRQDLLAVFNDFDNLDRLPDSFRIGIMTLIHKKDDKMDLKNWRPITLLNFDCKLFSKLLKLRMSTVLADLIHPDQACAVPGRKITDSLVLIRDSICYARDRNIRLIVLNLDFEKAFDRVSHHYLFQVLGKMGFPGRFLAWVGLLYKGITSRILVNGKLSKAIDIRSGVRQGCPLSPLLYVACIEPLAQALRRDQWINGLTIPGTGGLTAKTVLYMDDVNLLCTDVLSIQRIMDMTDWFGKASGARLNRDKTQAQFYGPWKPSEPAGLGVTSKNTDLKILGIKFDREGGGSGNWHDVMSKVRKKLGFWRLRRLTVEGKVLIIKAVILPLLLLLCSVFKPPRFFLLALDRAIFYFLWSSKWERLRREVLKKSPKNGGKGVPDFHLFLGAQYTALHLKYATSTSKEEKTAAMARFWMGSYLRFLKILTVDLTTPVAFNLPSNYSFIKGFLKHFKLEKEDVTILTNHRAILSVVQERESVSPVRGLTLSEAQIVWRKVSHPILRNRHRDLAWMTAHEILPVRAVMHSRGMARNPICPRPGCGDRESVRHALWECRVVRDLWAQAGPQQFPSLPVGGVPNYHLVLGATSQKERPANRETKLWLTINCIKDAIWTSRNLLVGKHVEVSLQAILQLAQARLQEYTTCCQSDVGAGASQGKVPAATSPDCP